MSNIDSYIEQCMALCDIISEMCTQPLESITALDMSVMRRKGLDLSILAMRVQMDMADMRYKYDLEQGETIDTLMSKMKKSVSFSKEAGKYQADKLHGKYRILDELLRGIDRVLKQVEGFAVQWNVMNREQGNYLSTGLKDLGLHD